MIKHDWFTTLDGKKRYVCNQAVDVTDEKLAHTKEEVSCKNCINMSGGYCLGGLDAWCWGIEMDCYNCQETMKYKVFKKPKLLDVGRRKKVLAKAIYYCDDCSGLVWVPVENHERHSGNG